MKAGVRRISLHGLRDAAATLALERGLPVHAVAARLGHDPAVLLRRYSHAVDDSQAAAAQLESLLDGDQPALRVVADEDEQPDEEADREEVPSDPLPLRSRRPEAFAGFSYRFIVVLWRRGIRETSWQG